MQIISTLTTTLFVAATTLVPLASADCYVNGRYGDVETVEHHAKRACEGYDGHRGAFQGHFKANEKKKACVNTDFGKLNMEVTNLSDKGVDTKKDVCTNGMLFVIDDCSVMVVRPLTRGGKWNRDGLLFQVNPNAKSNC